MARQKTKNINRIKRNYSWLALILFSMLSVILLIVVSYFIQRMTDYIVNTKLLGKYELLGHYAKDYELQGEAALDTFKEDNVKYVIKDSDNNVISENDGSSCGTEKLNIVLPNNGKKFSVYLDSEKNIFRVDRYKNLKVDNSKAFEAIGSVSDVVYPESNDETTYEGNDQEVFNQVLGDTLVYPVWISYEVNDKSEEIIFKAETSVNMDDFYLIAVYFAIFALFIFFTFIIILITIISNFTRNRKALRIFFTDPITLGNNWIWFTYRSELLLRKMINAKNNYAVVDISFVNYRSYCLCHSLDEGEKLLKKVNDLLVKSVNKKELIAHVNSSNFAMLLKYENPDQLKMRLYKIIESLERISDGHEHSFSFQAGVDLMPAIRNEKGRFISRKGMDIDNEYNNACTARASLKNADESGVFIFNDELVKEQRWLDQVMEEQRGAIEREEFLVYYQPKYDPVTDELRGAEALVRWQSPKLGFVSPGKFIPIFEKTGFITEIDHYMLRHVARDQKRWLDRGFKCVPVSVNVSRAHFVEEDLAEQIRDIVDAEGAPRNLVEIELTESAFFDDKKVLLTTVKRLQEYGFTVSMDDFGSGYSSLNSLKDMPLDVLKIDAEFFRGDNAGSRGKVVVAETIKLAKELDMRIVAEGVEVKETVDFLADQGCDMIQGYYYSKPLPKQEYEEKM
ncbi:MAG: GGDEF domain-containing phosphodiesterase [Lachnospiraceae bacterium]|nr:GGDEF domain-containing phosphodiesterase [Lachnospiraceae bacterium]